MRPRLGIDLKRRQERGDIIRLVPFFSSEKEFGKL